MRRIVVVGGSLAGHRAAQALRGLGFDGQLCGRLSSLNHRVDTPAVLNWLSQFV